MQLTQEQYSIYSGTLIRASVAQPGVGELTCLLTPSVLDQGVITIVGDELRLPFSFFRVEDPYDREALLNAALQRDAVGEDWIEPHKLKAVFEAVMAKTDTITYDQMVSLYAKHGVDITDRTGSGTGLYRSMVFGPDLDSDVDFWLQALNQDPAAHAFVKPYLRWAMRRSAPADFKDPVRERLRDELLPLTAHATRYATTPHPARS